MKLNLLRFFSVFALLIASGALIVSAQEQEDTFTTNDGVLMFSAPEGWTLDVFDAEAQQAELDELGFSFDFPEFGVPVTLESRTDMFARVDIDIFYGQYLVDLLAMFGQTGVDYTDTEAVLNAIANLFGMTPEPEFGVLVLPDGREVPYYDEVYESDFSDMPDMNMGAIFDDMGAMFGGMEGMMPEGMEGMDMGEMFGDMGQMFGGMEDGDMGDMMQAFGQMFGGMEGMEDMEGMEAFGQMMDQMFGGMMGGLQDSEMITRDTTRYYALNFETTGVVLVSAYLGAEFENAEGAIGSMAEMMAGLDANNAEVIEQFLPLIQPAGAVPVVEEREAGELGQLPGMDFQPPELGETGALSYSVPDGYFVIDDDPEFGYLAISNDPDIDAFGPPEAPGVSLVLAIYGYEMNFIFEDLGLSQDADISTLAQAFIGEFMDELTAELTMIRFGAADGYTFSGSVDGMEGTFYMFDTQQVGAVMVVGFTDTPIPGSPTERDIIAFILSMV